MLRSLGLVLALPLLICLGLFALVAPFWLQSSLHKRKAERIRPTALEATIRNAKPLIQAIHSYTEDHRKPPPTLEALGPGYIKSIPNPGPLAYNGWHYEVTGEPQPGEWALFVRVNREYAPNRWSFGDTFAYLSDGRYPREAYRGILEQVGRWGYYHE